MNKNQKRRWMVALSVSAGAVMAAIDTFILYVATPHLRGTFSATLSEISWVSTSYAVSSMIFMLLSGWLCRRYGQKKVYKVGLLVFIIGSALCGFSVSLDLLILSRIIQGVGAGILLPVENVILRQTFPPNQHGIVMGMYGTTIMIGPAFGPMLGGFIIDNFFWSLIFFVNIPIGIISLIMVQHFVPEDVLDDKPSSSVDLIGIGLLIVGMFSFIWLLERGDRLYWFDSFSNLILLFVAVSALAMFCAHELMTDNPAVDLRILKNISFCMATFLNFLMGFIVTATLFILPIYMQDSLGFTATKAGTALAPRALFMMLAFPLIGYLTSRVSPKGIIIFGLLLGYYSAFLMSKFSHESGWFDMVFPQILQGIAVAMVLTPLSAVVLMGINPKKLSAAAGFDSMSRQIGGSLGIAIFSTLLTHYESIFWGGIRHNVSLAYTVFYKRFDGVLEFFLRSTPSESLALEKSMRLLNIRVNEQVSSLTYMHLFQILMVMFMCMILFSMLAKFESKKILV